ncbi:MAG: M24 family metallopeptidase [Chloroflexota bacterium]
MKSDLDALMQERGVDALLVVGPGFHNPAMTYLSGGGHMTQADLVKRRGQAPVLFCRSMEREEAARTGLPTYVIDEYPMGEFIKQAGGDLLQATALRYQRMLTDLSLTQGRVALYGQMDAGISYSLFSAISQLLPGLQVFGEMGRPLLLAAMATKDAQEIERIRTIGRITTSVVGDTADFITSHAVRNDVVVKKDGAPLTIGEVKQQIDLWLAQRGAENPEGTIFAIGHDAGVPHSTGINSDPLRLGQMIVFDIFPREAGGGYFYDMTRTWCLGYAPDEAQALYQDVWNAYQTLRGELALGAPTHRYQDRVCDLFEAGGHPTLRQNPATTNGYVHSLGHGVGLHIHENPFFRSGPAEEFLEPGVVITLEPGLYYPERGLGARVEDTLWACPDGQFEPLAEYPYDLVLPMQQG